MNSMVEALARNAELFPEKLFIADSFDSRYTYRDSWRRVKRIAWMLKNEYILSFESRVMAFCYQNAEYVLLKLVCDLVGCVFVPVEKEASLEKIEYICSDTQSELIVMADYTVDFANLSAKSVTYSDIMKMEDEYSAKTFPPSDSLSEILYTSGTTGNPKGVEITNGANIALAENIMYGAGIEPENVELIPMPISHSHGLRCCYANLLCGSSVILVDGVMDARRVFELMEMYSVSSMDMSPGLISMFLRLSPGAFIEHARKLSFIEMGTEIIPENLKKRLIDSLSMVHLYNFYGSTESGRSSVLDFSIQTDKKSCIGKPTHNAELVFMNDKKEIIDATFDHPGLLASRGPMTMRGYWNNDNQTQDVMWNGYILSGDIGYKDEEGFYYIIGRRDDIINYGGLKISPAEIEEEAIRFEYVNDAALIAATDPILGQIPVLYVSVREGFVKECFADYLKGRIDSNKMPKTINIIDVIPKTYNGKNDRRSLSVIHSKQIEMK